MSTILRSFCIVACFVSGIYSCIIYYHFHNAKRMLWFSALCFALCINTYMGFSFNPELLSDAGYTSGITSNVYLCSYAIVTLCLNIYSGLLAPEKLYKIHTAFNYICFVLAVLCMIISGHIMMPMFSVLRFMAVTVYIFSLLVSFQKIRDGEKTYWYPAVGYILFILSSWYSLFALFTGRDAGSPRVYVTPVFLVLHTIMVTRQYRISTEKTIKLSSSLSDTIERINHSDTALMCTQMKADFLYKSLDLIAKKCDEDTFIAEDLTISLSKYLRHTLNFQQLKGIVPLTNEIELTKSFISIEKERYPKLSFEYRFPNPLPDFYIPPLSIQPLVENAIEHGFSDDEENPKITITIIPYRDYFHIDVSDNGIGMDEDTVSQLTDSLCDSARIGIYNIHTRLINLFGKGLVIQSAPGVGTSVSFVVPPDAKAYIEEKEGKAE